MSWSLTMSRHGRWLKTVVERAGYEVRAALIGDARRRDLHAVAARRRRCSISPARRRRPELVRRLKERDAWHRGDRHQRPGHHRRGPSKPARPARSSSSRSRSTPTACIGDARAGDRADARAGRERAAQATAARSLQLREHHRPSQKMRELFELVDARRRQRRQHPDPGRERHRQGADRQRAPLPQPARQGPVHQDQLRGDSEGPDRVGAVRLQEGRLHRRVRPTRSACSSWPRAAR